MEAAIYFIVMYVTVDYHRHFWVKRITLWSFHNFDAIISAGTFLQSAFDVYKKSDAEKPLKRFRRRQIPNVEGYLPEKLLLFKKKCSDYAGELT